jgi:beta-glucanase (GH16 family)
MEFSIGRFEARIKLPYGQGIWPAFWLLGSDIDAVHWLTCGEIDIMENIGREPSIIHGTMHGPGYSGGGGLSSAYSLSNNQ